jgi:hypothetical protein
MGGVLSSLVLLYLVGILLRNMEISVSIPSQSEIMEPDSSLIFDCEMFLIWSLGPALPELAHAPSSFLNMHHAALWNRSQCMLSRPHWSVAVEVASWISWMM